MVRGLSVIDYLVVAVELGEHPDGRVALEPREVHLRHVVFLDVRQNLAEQPEFLVHVLRPGEGERRGEQADAERGGARDPSQPRQSRAALLDPVGRHSFRSLDECETRMNGGLEILSCLSHLAFILACYTRGQQKTGEATA